MKNWKIKILLLAFGFLALPNFSLAETPPVWKQTIITSPTAPNKLAYVTSPTGLAKDAAGNFYVVDGVVGFIQKFDANGNFLRSIGSYGSNDDQFINPIAVAVDSSSNIYVLDIDTASVKKFDSTGTFLLKWGQYGSVLPGYFNNPTDIAIDSTGKVYVVDSGNYRIQKFNPDGSLISQFGSMGSIDGRFKFPEGIVIDSSDNVWVADTGNNRIQKFTSSNGILYTFAAKYGSYGSGNLQFDSPSKIAIDSGGNIFVGDVNNARIQKLSSTGAYLSQFGSDGIGDGQFTYLQGILFDSSNNLYVADPNNSRIQKFDSTGTFLAKWQSFGTAAGQFNHPMGITADKQGNIFVSDTFNNRIQKFNSAGVFISQWGSTGTGDGQFVKPYGIATDSSGNVFVVDQNNTRIQKFTSSGTFIATWGSAGSAEGQFSYPFGISIDAADHIFIADAANNRIQKFDTSGNFLAQFGTVGSGNGQLAYPNSVSVDKYGNIFVADSGNARIQKLDANGGYITQWAMGTNGIATDPSGNVFVAASPLQKFDANGNLLSQFGDYGVAYDQTATPNAVFVDSKGIVFVADTYNNRIQIFGDIEKPTEVTNLSSPSQTTTSISLAWQPSTDNIAVTSYNLYKNGELLTNITNTTDRAFTDTALTPATSYTYTISALDQAGNESSQSSPITVSTLTLPDDPIVIVTPTETPQKAKIDSYKIFQKDSNKNCTQLIKIEIQGKNFDSDAKIEIGDTEGKDVNKKDSKNISASFCLDKMLTSLTKNPNRSSKKELSITNPEADKETADKKIDLNNLKYSFKKTNLNTNTKEGIKNIQTLLYQKGYLKNLLYITGNYGDITKEAVRNFQKDKGLAATGLLDAKTLKKLSS